jgi:hypothetical protein
MSALIHRIDAEFLSMQQVDQDRLVDFLQAVGPSAIRARPRREG